MKKIHALVMSLIMLFIVLAPAQNVEAAGIFQRDERI